jgi:hypothetical protein
MSLERRIERLEIEHWRRPAAEAGAERGFSADQILDECIQFLEMPHEERMREYPHYTEAEHRTMESWLPHIRRARWGHRRPLD